MIRAQTGIRRRGAALLTLCLAACAEATGAAVQVPPEPSSRPCTYSSIDCPRGTHRTGTGCGLSLDDACLPGLRRAEGGGCEPYEPEPWPWTAADVSSEVQRRLSLARERAESGQREEACRLYEEAARERRHPTALLELARCDAGRGKLVSAWARYRELARVELQQGAPPVVAQAVRAGRAEGEEVAARLPHLRVMTPPEVSGIEVGVDGTPVPLALAVAGLVVDPGAHRIAITALGRVPMVLDAELREGEVRMVAPYLRLP